VNLAFLQKQHWLIAPEALGAMVSATKSFFEQKQELPSPPTSACLSVEDGVAIVSICGPMLRNPDIFDRVILGACDTDEVIKAVAEAGAHPDIEAIFLDIDSPGGSVNGTPELAQAVADASKAKYVYAFSAGQMCSAAYWVASQADAIYATPSARVGSIGVILPVVDSSAAFEQAGLKMEVFAAGKFKSSGTPGTSLTEDQREWLQSEVEETAAAALAMLEIDEDGFDEMDKRIIEGLINLFHGGPVGLSSLAVAIGEEPGTLEEVHEPYLIMQGYLKRTPQGRIALPRAYRKIGLEPPRNSPQDELF